MDCPAEFTTDTQDELMQHVQLHAGIAHPDLEITPELAEQIQKLVRTS
jgi:predicted small metal-binding protein